MVKRIALVTALGLALMTPTLSANADDLEQGVKGKTGRAVRVVRGQVREGVKAGRISPAALAKLKSEIQAIHGRIKSLRQSGQRATLEQRRQIRADLKKLVSDMRAARGGR